MTTNTNYPIEWNLSLLVPEMTDEILSQLQAEVERVCYEFINKWKDRDDYLSDPDVLRTALDEFELLLRNFGLDGKYGFYYYLKSQQNQVDTDVKAKLNLISDTATKIRNDLQFFEMRIGKVSEDIQKSFLSASQLEQYRHFLHKLFLEAKYQLSEAEEKVVNLYSPMSWGNWTKLRSELISKSVRTVENEEGEVAERTYEEIATLLSSKDKSVRDKAAVALNDILSTNLDVAVAELNTILQTKKVSDTLRNTERPDTLRHMSDDIDPDVVDALCAAVSSKFEISQKFYQLKSKLLGQTSLEYHERNVPYGELDQEFTYDQAVEIVRSSLGKLDAEFAEIFDMFVSQGHIDVYPRVGKKGGAFCVQDLISSPVYIMLNYTNKLNDVTTLAHEVGHGINDVLISKTQNALNAHTPLSTAEVASTFMEDFAVAEIMVDVTPEVQLAFNMNKLGDEVATVFRQIALYNFELELHHGFREKGYLSVDEIGSLFRKHMAAYMGEYVVQNPGSQNWWVNWGHIRSPFYVYSYASGLLISKSLQSKVIADPAFITKIKQFLSAGSSASPKQIFADLGIDIANPDFWMAGLQETEKLLDETWELAKSLGKV